MCLNLGMQGWKKKDFINDMYIFSDTLHFLMTLASFVTAEFTFMF